MFNSLTLFMLSVCLVDTEMRENTILQTTVSMKTSSDRYYLLRYPPESLLHLNTPSECHVYGIRSDWLEGSLYTSRPHAPGVKKGELGPGVVWLLWLEVQVSAVRKTIWISGDSCAESSNTASKKQEDRQVKCNPTYGLGYNKNVEHIRRKWEHHNVKATVRNNIFI